MASSSVTQSTVSTDHTIYPYSEVGGIGVLIGFGSTTFLTVTVLVVNYIAFYDPRGDLLSQQVDARLGEDLRVNLYDEWVFNVRAVVRRWLLAGVRGAPTCGAGGSRRWWHFWVMNRRERDSARKWFEKLILRLCDGHFIVGYSYLISGFASVFLEEKETRQEQMSLYHWKILLDCAWYSASTHLAGFIFLRRYFADRPVQRTFRILCVGIFVSCLIFASLPKMDYELEDWDPVLKFWKKALAPGGIRRLLFHQEAPDAPCQIYWTLLSLFLLASNFLLRSGELAFGAPDGPYVRARAFMSKHSRNVLSWLWIQNGGCLADLWNQAVMRPLISIFLVARLYVDLYQSMAVKTLTTVLFTLWGSLSLYKTRFANALSPPDDNKWAFGQISAVVASGIPIFAVVLYLCKSLDKTLEPDSVSARPISDRVSVSPQAALERRPSKSVDPQRSDMPSLLYRDYSESLWRPWASSFAMIYGICASMQSFGVFGTWSMRPAYAWRGLVNMVAPYFVAQLPIVIMYVVVSAGLESSLNKIDWDRRRRRRRRASRIFAWRVVNGATYLAFSLVIFCSVTDRSPFFEWKFASYLARLCGLYTFQSLRIEGTLRALPKWDLVVDMPAYGGLLWYIMMIAVGFYEFACFATCLMPLIWRCVTMRKGVHSRQGGTCSDSPVWRAPRTATWPARQPWRDGPEVSAGWEW